MLCISYTSNSKATPELGTTVYIPFHATLAPEAQPIRKVGDLRHEPNGHRTELASALWLFHGSSVLNNGPMFGPAAGRR